MAGSIDLAEPLTIDRLAAEAVEITASNTLEFVAEVFHQQAAGKLVVVHKPGAPHTVLPGARTITFPGATTGWSGGETIGPPTGPHIAQVVFSSGTTGAPKAIALSADNIADSVARLNRVMQLDASVREYVGVPAHYSFGLGRCRAVAAVGGRYYLPPNGFDPSEIAGMLSRGEINAISAVPTLWRLLLQNEALIGEAGPSLKWLEIGSQSMSAAEKDGLKRLFPNAVAVQHYGLTEASRTTFLKLHEETGEALTSVGRAEDGVEIRRLDDGRIAIRGAHVAPFEIDGEALRPLTGADGWLVTNDLGEIRDGRLFIHGRADDLINCGGVKLHPDALEDHIRATLGLSGRIAVCRVPHQVRGEGVLVCYADPTVSEDAVRAAATKAAGAFDLQAAGALSVRKVDVIPTTETGKVRRAALAEGFVQAEPKAAPAKAARSLEDAIVRLWHEELGADATAADNFLDLGGDALAASELAPKMQALGVTADGVRGMLEGLSIAEIAALSRGSAAEAGSNDAEARILAIWREALGREDVSVDDSFYDVGGDSISAVLVALSQEQAGFDKALAHGIFDGMTVAELARTAAPAAGAAATAPAVRRKTEIAVFSEASNFIKGLILLCMISSHWLPVYLDVIGKRYGELAMALAPFFSLGTPTLAFMFGMGITVFYLRQYEKSRESFDKNIRTGVMLLAGGLVLGSGIQVVTDTLNGARMSLADMALFMIEGPFVYYLLATLTIPLWIGFLGRGNRTIAGLFAASGGLYLAYEMLKRSGLFGPDAVGNVMIGHWALPQMAAISLAGAAAGLIIDRHLRNKGSLTPCLIAGGAILAASLGASALAGDFRQWVEFPKNVTLWGAFGYAGLALVILGLFQRVAGVLDRAAVTRLAVQFVCCVGILLFPLYVLQSFVYSTAETVAQFAGLALHQGLTICIALFALASAYPLWRIYKLYYGGRS